MQKTHVKLELLITVYQVCGRLGWEPCSLVEGYQRFGGPYYSKICLKRNLKGPEHFSAQARFPFNRGIL
jgi:hypothetical protein